MLWINVCVAPRPCVAVNRPGVGGGHFELRRGSPVRSFPARLRLYLFLIHFFAIAVRARPAFIFIIRRSNVL